MPKNIVLCSDGTGNKGGYGEDTNVYKVYKAVDIHNEKKQITFYDQGVGTDKSDTSKNKYYTALSGAFGFGFEANVRHLYHFLARCHEPGDAIFLFGFSRGAATVRAFAGLINACGLIDKKAFLQSDDSFDEYNFRELVKEAFNCYQSADSAIQKDFKDRYAIKDQDYSPEGNLKIKFIGVWDTVSALGFPRDFSKVIEWFIDYVVEPLSNKIWPHQFYDYELNPSIENAYHALAIDDERTTFHPKVWNEHIARGTGYVEQVWFAGVHSNVGGGYPRTGMSDVALEWMIAKAEAHGLVFYDDRKTEDKEGANIHDKLYDSRDGVAVYYRYGPRKIRELCQNKLKGNVAIHASAYEKIKDIGDAYAPDGLPCNFDVVELDPNDPSKSVTKKTVVVIPGDQADEWKVLEGKMNALIQNRKYLYRVFVELTLLILILAGILWSHPGWIIDPKLILCAEGGLLVTVAHGLIYVTPAYFENFIIYVVCVKPLIFPTMLSILYLMNRLRKSWTNKLGDICRRMCELL